MTQAVDYQVQFLRNPLTSANWGPPLIEKLVIVGGGTDLTRRLVQGLHGLLSVKFAVDICMVKALTDIDFDIFGDVRSTILSLAELDGPIFESITPETFRAVRNVFGAGKRVFWVTSGRLDLNPFSNMTVGFGRVAANESPDLRLQQLDIHGPEQTSPETVARVFLRFYASEFQGESVLWSREPELRIDCKGHQLISRLRPVSELNDRYNSAEETITHETSVEESSIMVEYPSKSGALIRRLSAWETSLSTSHPSGMNHLTLCVLYATSAAIRTPFGHKFVVLGSRLEDGSKYLSLASKLTSILTVPAESATAFDVTSGHEQMLLSTVVSHLIATAVIGHVLHGQSALVHHASHIMAQALKTQAGESHTQVIFTTDLGCGYDNDFESIDLVLSHDMTTPGDEGDHVLVPRNTVVFADLGSEEFQCDTWAIASNLPAHCRIENGKTLYSSTGSDNLPYTGPALGRLLEQVLRFAQADLKVNNGRPPDSFKAGFDVVSLADIINKPFSWSHLKIVDFNRQALIPAQVTRLDARRIFKGSGSTYWVAGITGALGISLCDWMIRSGARSIVMTSRAPEISSDWIDSHKRKGAIVTVIAW